MRSAWRILLRPGGLFRTERISFSGTLWNHLPSSQALRCFPSNSTFTPHYPSRANSEYPSRRFYSSEISSVEPCGEDHALLLDIFSGNSGLHDVETRLESADIKFDHGFLNSSLRSLDGKPDVAVRLFNWAAEKKPDLLSAETYNSMLGFFAAGGKSSEFWEMVEVMKKKGYCLSKNAFFKASKSFDQLIMHEDLGKLKELYASNSSENWVPRTASRVCKILREGDELGDEVWKSLKDLDPNYSSDLVFAVLEKLSSYPAKAFLFFRWASDNASFKPEGKSYNAMARILGREGSMERFWDLLQEMKLAGQGLEPETYLKVSRRFLSRGMTKEAVDFFEHAMDAGEKPSLRDFLHLMRKIVMCRELELHLVSRTVRIFKNGGYPLKDSIFGSVLKSVVSVGRLGECSSLLKAMEEGGFSASRAVTDRVAVELCRARKPDEALEFILEKEASGHKFDPKSWVSLIQCYSQVGSTEKCLSSFNRMIEKNGSEKVGFAFEALVTAHLRRSKVLDVYKVLSAMVEKNKLEPLQSTYKVLIKRLLSEGKLKEASSLLTLMKRHGYPPFIEPFFGYISKFGSGEDAMVFLKSMTVKSFPSISVFIRTLEGVLKAGRKETADDLLSKSPCFVRNHADVLNLVYSHNSPKGSPNPDLAPA
ncbi:pentatricopeptide repeat-containing protein At3g02490, mitochondrial-like [Wolffia australiana]